MIILKDLKKHLAHYFKNELINVILFGSQLKNKTHPYSDYDVLIILKSSYNWKIKNKIIDLCYDIDLKYNIIIDPLIIAQEEMNSIRGKQPIFVNALQHGIKA